jgi:hypothetical protein
MTIEEQGFLSLYTLPFFAAPPEGHAATSPVDETGLEQSNFIRPDTRC